MSLHLAFHAASVKAKVFQSQAAPFVLDTEGVDFHMHGTLLCELRV